MITTPLIILTEHLPCNLPHCFPPVLPVLFIDRHAHWIHNRTLSKSVIELT